MADRHSLRSPMHFLVTQKRPFMKFYTVFLVYLIGKIDGSGESPNGTNPFSLNGRAFHYYASSLLHQVNLLNDNREDYKYCEYTIEAADISNYNPIIEENAEMGIKSEKSKKIFFYCKGSFYKCCKTECCSDWDDWNSYALYGLFFTFMAVLLSVGLYKAEVEQQKRQHEPVRTREETSQL